MSASRRFRLRGNTVKSPEAPAPATQPLQVSINVVNDMGGILSPEQISRFVADLTAQTVLTRRLQSNAPLPASVSIGLGDLEQTYGMPRRQALIYSDDMRYRGYSENHHEQLMHMQAQLFSATRAVDYLLDLDHGNWQQRPMNDRTDVFLVFCGLLAHCSQDTERQRSMMGQWVADGIRANSINAAHLLTDTELMRNTLQRYARTATLGSLPDVFRPPPSSPRQFR